MKKKYQIFISSTYKDLVKARAKVRDAILSMMHFPVGMEMFNAADEEQWEIIKETIDSSDYYVLILGQRYGSEIEEGSDAGISYTEKEFRYATEKKIPILVFIMADSVPLQRDFIESDSQREKLEKFKVIASHGHTVQWWENEDELARKVIASLHQQMDRKERTGWIRGDSFDIEASYAELLKLNKKIRELEEENEKLKSQIVVRKPHLKVSFVIAEVDSAEESKKEECYLHGGLVQEISENHIKMREITGNAENYRNKYEPLEIGYVDAHLRPYVRKEDIQKYNESLPDAKAIDEYIKQMRVYEKLKKGGVALYLKIENDGTAKATDVRVSATFPECVHLMNIDDVKKLVEPPAPKLPPNPIDAAEKEYERKMNPMVDLANYFACVQPSYSFDAINSSFLSNRLDTKDYCFYINENSIFAENRQLPHKDAETFDVFYMVPVKKGDAKIKISMMCSEYVEPEEQYIDIQIV